MNNNFCTYQNQIWVVSVSGGPDSMALLDMALNCNVNCIVVHVNYHKRDSAHRDENIVREYCKKHKIKCVVFDGVDFKGNFQDEARRFRYLKLKEVILREEAVGAFVGHHKDDDLETLLFQITRKSKVSYYGLSKSTLLFQIRVDRPLLDYTKNELIEYCEKNSILYGIDESNESMVYSRNQIRKELSNLNDNEKLELFKIKKEYNQNRAIFKQTYTDLLNQTSISHNDYISLFHNSHRFLFEWLRMKTDLYPISDKFIKELDRQLLTSKSVKLRLTDTYRMIKQYKTISIVEEKEDYRYQVNIYERLDASIKLCYEKRAAYIKVSLAKDSFPITITNLRACRKLIQSNTYTKLSKWFIKNKITVQEREMWPLVFNRENELLYILSVGYEHDVSTDTIDCYMIK